MKINCYGPKKGSGLGNAFLMHTEALRCFLETELFDIKEIADNETINTYNHGSGVWAHITKPQGRTIAYWMCESTELQPYYAEFENLYTDIWTGSTYCQRIFEEQLQREIKVIPHCTREYFYNPTKNSIPVILITFDGHSRFARKNPIKALEACRRAFGKECRVIMKTRHLKPSFLKWIQQEAEDLDFHLVNENLAQEELNLLYSNCDILLSLHKCEGFGLHLLEAMAFGCKVVATGYGGNMDFMNPTNSYPVSYYPVPCEDEYFRGEWAEPNMEHAVQQLRKAYDDDFEINKQAFDTALTFSFTNTVQHTKLAL